MHMLDDAGVSYQIVLTKTDQVGANELALIAERTRTEMTAHAAAYPEIYLTSALKRRGIAALRATLSSFAVLAVPPTTVAAPAPRR
jgi:GTP-binding protein